MGSRSEIVIFVGSVTPKDHDKLYLGKYLETPALHVDALNSVRYLPLFQQSASSG